MSASAAAPLTESIRTRAEINRANAQHSTGPRTPEGKARSAMNALKHGLFSQDAVLPDEDREQFEQLALAIAQDFHAETEHELSLVQDIADCRWRAHRVCAHESALIILTTEQQRPAVNTLFEGTPYQDDAPYIDALSRAAGFQANSRLFNQLSVNEMRLFRRAELIEKKLVDLVNKREAQALASPDTTTTQATQTPIPTIASGFVPDTSRPALFPPNMPHFTGPLKKENRRQWLRKHGHNELAKAA